MGRKILAFGGSSSRHSINKKLAIYVDGLFNQAAVDVIDFILLSLAEQNGAYSAAFKNIFDWNSRIPERKFFGGKKIFLLSTSPGARGGASVMEIAAQHFPFDGGQIVGTFSLLKFRQNFQEGLGVTNENLKNNFKRRFKK